MPLSFFDEIVGVGDRYLESLSGIPITSESPSHRYLITIQEIYSQLASIHRVVATVAMHASLARDPGELDKALRGVNMDVLERVFQVQQWCNTLERLGLEARKIPLWGGFSPADHNTWRKLSGSLVRRETEVAVLYEDNLEELRDLAKGNLHPDDIRKRAADISKQLVRQKAEFELLADKAKAMLNYR
jgi:hypothetical protein